MRPMDAATRRAAVLATAVQQLTEVPHSEGTYTRALLDVEIREQIDDIAWRHGDADPTLPFLRACLWHIWLDV